MPQQSRLSLDGPAVLLLSHYLGCYKDAVDAESWTQLMRVLMSISSGWNDHEEQCCVAAPKEVCGRHMFCEIPVNSSSGMNIRHAWNRVAFTESNFLDHHDKSLCNSSAAPAGKHYCNSGSLDPHLSTQLLAEDISSVLNKICVDEQLVHSITSTFSQGCVMMDSINEEQYNFMAESPVDESKRLIPADAKSLQCLLGSVSSVPFQPEIKESFADFKALVI